MLISDVVQCWNRSDSLCYHPLECHIARNKLLSQGLEVNIFRAAGVGKAPAAELFR